jgi:ATP-binding cassette, subfamily C (CFTR/MRP), member 1
VLLDLWQLPSSLLTESITAEIERNFYARCSPDKRPIAINDDAGEQSTEFKDVKVAPETASNDFSESNKGKDNKEADVTTTEQQTNTLPGGDQSTDAQQAGTQAKNPSLLAALYIAFRWQWLVSGLLKLASGELIMPSEINNVHYAV